MRKNIEKNQQDEIPFQISFRDFEKSDFVSAAVQERIEKLIHFTSSMKILFCDVVVSRPHHHGNKGNIYHIEIRLHVPGDYIIIDKEPERNHAHEDIYVAIRDAFDSMERKLESYINKRQGFVKTHTSVSKTIS